MKKTAALLLFLFAFVQAVPAVCSIFSSAECVFIVDEEKAEDKTEADKKEKKVYTGLLLQSSGFTHKISTAIQLAERIHPFPCLEKLTPPPNFC